MAGPRGAPPGKKLAWRIWEGRALRGYIGLGEPAFKLAPRRRLEGRDEIERSTLAMARPLPGTVGNFVFRLEARGELRASDILKAWHAEAELAWLARYGSRPEHWETLCQPGACTSPTVGACFRRAGYRSLGLTTGRSARRPPGSTHGARIWSDAEPKIVLYRGPLARLPSVGPADDTSGGPTDDRQPRSTVDGSRPSVAPLSTVDPPAATDGRSCAEVCQIEPERAD